MVEFSLARQVRPSRPASARSLSTLGLSYGLTHGIISRPPLSGTVSMYYVLLYVLVIIIINDKYHPVC